MRRDTRSTQAIKAVRLAAGLTQHAFAQRLGVTARTVQRWEAGTRAMPRAAWVLLQQYKRTGRTALREDNTKG